MPGDLNLLISKLRKALAQLPDLLHALGLVWSVARPWTIAWTAMLILQGLLPAAIVYLTKLIVDGVVAAMKSGSNWTGIRSVLILVVTLGAIMILMEVVRSGISWVRTIQAELLKDHISALIHEKSVTADLAFYDQADYYDHLHRARSEASYRPIALLENIGSLLQNGITLIAMGAILIPLGPLLSLGLLISTIPAFVVVVRYALAEYQWQLRTTADDRRSWYYDWLMTNAKAAPELRLFGLGKYFRDRYAELRKKLRSERLQLARNQALAELLAGLIAMAIIGVAMFWMVWRALHGLVSLGELALIYAAFNQGQRLMRTLLENVGQLYANSLFLGNLFEFLALERLVPEVDPQDAEAPHDVDVAIRFNGVSFQYPDATTKALDNFDMVIPAGRIVAVVGPNGAGKSTFIKLLCRFYDPDEGNIEIDQSDLKQIPTDHLRRLITVLFQQPIHYNNTVRENVEFGDLEQEASTNEISIALHAAGAEEIVTRLPHGYDTMLGRWFTGGTELSAGEWQRIALARAFLRRARIIILDEPTSALDPWAESDWLQRFRRLANGRTSLVITHRFTTAMHADIIHVMQNGHIVESGNHQQLLIKNGPYAESWKQQMMAADFAEAQETR
jgi:ATP-binding cassette, subfamily B, bacterial